MRKVAASFAGAGIVLFGGFYGLLAVTPEEDPWKFLVPIGVWVCAIGFPACLLVALILAIIIAARRIRRAWSSWLDKKVEQKASQTTARAPQTPTFRVVSPRNIGLKTHNERLESRPRLRGGRNYTWIASGGDAGHTVPSGESLTVYDRFGTQLDWASSDDEAADVILRFNDAFPSD